LWWSETLGWMFIIYHFWNFQPSGVKYRLFIETQLLRMQANLRVQFLLNSGFLFFFIITTEVFLFLQITLLLSVYYETQNCFIRLQSLKLYCKIIYFIDITRNNNSSSERPPGTLIIIKYHCVIYCVSIN
jgi:hypothetical protein